jgi:chromosome segregation ATPase
MAKKPPPKGKLLKLKPKGKVLQLKPRMKPKGKVLQLKKKTGGATPTARKSPAVQAMPPRPLVADSEERLQEAMEELGEARIELSRLGHEMTAAHRQLEDHKLSSASARDNLRSELDAVRVDLKTALAELEIARADRERIATHAQKRIHELEEAISRLRSEMELQKKAFSSQPSAVSPKPEPESGV